MFKLLLTTYLVLLFFGTMAQGSGPLAAIGKPPGGGAAAPAIPDANGNAMNDADILASQFKAKDLDGIIKTLNLYVKPVGQTPSIDEIVNVFQKNKFLNALVLKHGLDLKNVNKGLSVTGTQGTTVLPQGIDLSKIFSPTKIADGLGSFVAERFKEELTIRYIKEFRDALTENDALNHWSTLLPSTVKILQTYGNVFDYKSLMTALREASKDDLEKLHENSLLFIEKHNSTLGIPGEDLYTALLIMDVFYMQAPYMNDPLKLISEIENNKWFKKIPASDIKNAFITAAKILASSKNNAGAFPSEIDLKKFLNEDFLYSFIGLVLERNKSEFSALKIGGQDVYSRLNEVAQASVFQSTYRSGERIQTSIRTYQKQENKDVLGLISEVSPATKELINGFYNDAKLDKAFGYIDQSVAIARLVEQEKYALTIIELIKLLEETGFDKKNPDAFATIKKYGTFIANIAQATSGAEVKEILEVAAMPVGSYQVKRHAFADISLNAYAGLAGGVEFRKDLPTDSKGQNGVFGFTAPVGLAFSRGARTTAGLLTNKSHTLFFSILDVGAITSYRLTNDSTEVLPDFTWKNILSPGVFYWYGLKETPLSFGIGIQQGPQLRGIKSSAAVIDESNWMLRLSLSVDIPIINFYARTSKKSKK